MTAAQRKEELRRRAAMLPQMKAQALLEQFAALPEVCGARTVMVFCGVGREADTLPLISTLLERGQQVALPVCLPRRQMEARLITSPDQLIPNRWGIPEPDEQCPVIPKDQIQVTLVPCVMCSRDGYRLGHGGGYYDRWLADYPGFTVCVCPKTHLTEDLPREPFDRPVQLVLTDG